MSVSASPACRMVLRTARLGLRVTPAHRHRLLGMLACGGDVWAALIELNRERFRRGGPPIVNYQALCRELAGADLGELDTVGARSVLRRYSDAWFETARRRRVGERARYPRRKRRLFPLRYYHGTFTLDGRRVRLPTADIPSPLWLRLSREAPYPPGQVRSVTLIFDAGRLWLDVTAAVPVEGHDLDPGMVAGVDLGVIHPYAVATADGDAALLVSGRALRAESRLHLDDSRQRARAMSAKQGARRGGPARRQAGSRRWRKLRAAQRKAETRHRRRVRQAHHEAAKAVVDWAVEHRVGTLVVGDPKGITAHDAGAVHNWRLRQWRRTHLMGCLTDKAEVAGIHVVKVDERGTSSTCPACRCRVPKPRGRTLHCRGCGYTGHRDLVGALNIAAKHHGGGDTRPSIGRIEHRRAGTVPARRDRRRHRYDQRRRRRSCPAPGRPPPPGERESLAPTARITPTLPTRREPL